MGSRENRRVIRVKPKDSLKVVVGSIGSDVRYEMQTNDLSNNGFFLNFDKPGRFPFTPSSIMEIWLELTDQKRIFFNGKMARVVYPSKDPNIKSEPGIAVRIVQIQAKSEKVLLDYIAEMNKKLGTNAQAIDEEPLIPESEELQISGDRDSFEDDNAFIEDSEQAS